MRVEKGNVKVRNESLHKGRGFSFEWFSGIILVKYNLTEAQGARSGDRSAEH
jgi:hypothetical protein